MVQLTLRLQQGVGLRRVNSVLQPVVHGFTPNTDYLTAEPGRGVLSSPPCTVYAHDGVMAPPWGDFPWVDISTAVGTVTVPKKVGVANNLAERFPKTYRSALPPS